jgi:hypothetical protein
MSWQKYERTTTVSLHEKRLYGNGGALYVKVRAWLEVKAEDNIEIDGKSIRVQVARENDDGSTTIRITGKGTGRHIACFILDPKKGEQSCTKSQQ